MKQVLSHNFRDTCLPNVSKVTHERSWDPSHITKVKNADSTIQAIYSCFFVLFCFVLHVPTPFSICAKQIYKKKNRRRV